MRYRDILSETVLNAHTVLDKQQYADDAFALIQAAYGAIGGHINYPTPEAMVAEDSWWKLVRRNGKIIALIISKNRQGVKRVAIATDGSRAAKLELRKLVVDDIKLSRAWSEVSGSAANLFVRLGLPPVPNEYASEILHKTILATHGRFKYDRLIGGHVHTKMIVGYPNGERYELEYEPQSDEVLF